MKLLILFLTLVFGYVLSCVLSVLLVLLSFYVTKVFKKIKSEEQWVSYLKSVSNNTMKVSLVIYLAVSSFIIVLLVAVCLHLFNFKYYIVISIIYFVIYMVIYSIAIAKNRMKINSLFMTLHNHK